MPQSLAVSKDFYQAAHYGLRRGVSALVKPEKRLWNGLASFVTIGAFDYFSFSLPLGTTWEHEEFHRAVLKARGVDSYNNLYEFVQKATRVRDEDLSRLKALHPQEFVRLQAAGLEGEYLLIERLEKDNFFHGTKTFNVPFYLLSTLSNLNYLRSNSEPGLDAGVDEDNARDGADVSRRDFTGPDFTAWVYDLHRPAEPYSARGVHPSGTGIDRFVKFADLTAAEQRYLTKQRNLALLNFIDPQYFGVTSFRLKRLGNGDEYRGNFNVRHYLTSFGYTVDANLFFKTPRANWFFTYHNYQNETGYFPGAELQCLEHPVQIGRWTVPVTAQLGGWLQPKNQEFSTKTGELGGRAALRVALPVTQRLRPYAEVEGKTRGWAAGNVYLEPNVSGRFGLQVLLD